ncbi:hypothetical protein ACFX2H_003320 [Malus domestica]
MTSPHVLALPDFSIPFEIKYDASRQGIGAILQQQGRPIAFSSQALGHRNQSLSTYERELIAIVHTVKKWHNYLQGRYFVIRTDHHSLKYLLSNRAHTHCQQKWVTKLLGYDYEIHYKNGVTNVATDALSRITGANSLTEDVLSHDDQTGQCKAISYPYGGWMDELRRSDEQDEWIVQKVQQLLQESATMATQGSTLESKYHIDNGLLKYKYRVVLSPTSS